MRRFLTLVCLLCVAIPAGISISGCTRNPAAAYCNGVGYGQKITDVSSIFLQPQTTGVSIAFGQTVQVAPPIAENCKGSSATVSSYTYGTTNNQIADISPTGNICAGTWNRNTGGGIANYTYCNPPNPLPSTGGLPYATAYVTASANSVTSNPVEIYIHPQPTSITLVGPQSCLSQGQLAQLDAQACIVGANNQQELLCAPSSVSAANYACPLAPGVTSVPSCSVSLGTLSYLVGTGTVASINSTTNQITAEQPGTTVITASIANAGSLAGYFSTCPPKSISVTLANGTDKGTITEGVVQDLVTTILDTNNNPITGLTLDYQSTDPIDISAASGGALTASFPGVASVYAICQPPTCNPAPINVDGLNGTGLSIASNAVNVTVPGTASQYVWFGAPGASQYYVPIELLSGTLGTPVRLPYVPNSMVMDRLGQNLYFGSQRELMIYSPVSNTLTKTDTSAPGVVLAVAPNNSQILINDQVRQVFYIYADTGGVQASFGGMGNAAAWTPDSKTLYIADSASVGPGHSDTLYVYNANTGFTSYDLSKTTGGSQSLAITIPSVGAYLSGSAGFSTVARTWCPSGTVGNNASITFYPQGDSVLAQTDVLAATTDGNHILGAALIGGGVTLSDIGVTIPTTECPGAGTSTLTPLTIAHTLNQTPLAKVNATAVDQVVPSPSSSLAFITYTGSTPGALLPYYVPGTGGTLGTVGYLTLGGSAASEITAPVAGIFSPDNTLFFVSTAGDNLIHYINVPLVSSNPAKADTQQIAPGLPACTPLSAGGTDPGCTLTTPTANPVPATVITVIPRSTT
jgi:trimeric autotransporter adhesin